MDKQDILSSKSSAQLFVSARDFAARYGKDKGNFSMWLTRRSMADPHFPKVVFIGCRKFYRLEDIERFERACVASSCSSSVKS